MRCTKCSFISFDDLSSCAKCASDLSHLSKELNGTCIETRQEFFLGSAIQTHGLDEDNFSESQMLPPINQGDMNFDDTSTGGFSPISAPSADSKNFGFDDSMSVAAEDDVSIELGDIMPIDFDQLDSSSVLSAGTLEHTDSLNVDNLSFDLDKTDTLSPQDDNDLNLDFDVDFSDSGTDFKFDGDISDIDIGDLSEDLPVVMAGANTFSADDTLTDVSGNLSKDTDFDFDQELFENLSDDSGSFDETISLNADGGLNETQVSALSIEDDHSTPLELDESLIAELSGPSSLDLSGELSLNFSDHSASGDFELDAALVAELARGDADAAKGAGAEKALEFADISTEDVDLSFAQIEDLTGEFPPLREEGLGFSDHSASGDFELDPALVAELTGDEEVATQGVGEALSTTEVFAAGAMEVPVAQGEDLIGDFPSLREEDDVELSGLDLTDIDVSDLLDPSDQLPAADADGGRNQQQEGSVAQPVVHTASVDDTVREEAGSREFAQLDIQVEDDVDLEFDGEIVGEEPGEIDALSSGSEIEALAGEINLPAGNPPQDFSSSFLDDTLRESESVDAVLVSSEKAAADDILDVGSEIEGLAGEINLPAGNPPQDFSASFLDDTFRDGESADALLVSAEEDAADDLLDEELVLDDAGQDEDLPVDIDVLALDADFEAFLNKTAKGDSLPEIELISDDDDEDGPPDLPR